MKQEEKLFKNLIISIILFNIFVVHAQENKISKPLENRLSMAKADEIIKVWIYFTDKGDQINFNQIENNLTANAKQRRQKVMGKKLVDHFDAPLNMKYINALKPNVEKVVVRSKWLNAVSAEVLSVNIPDLTTYKFIKYIDTVKKFKRNQPEIEDTEIQPTASEDINTFDYGNSYTQNNQINVPVLHDMGITGNGVLICMLDNSYPLYDQHQAFSRK